MTTKTADEQISPRRIVRQKASKLHVQLLLRQKVVYEKSFVLRPGIRVYLTGEAGRDNAIFFPGAQFEEDKACFLRDVEDGLQVHALPEWFGFYATPTDILFLSNQDEWIGVRGFTFGSFQNNDYTLSWQIGENLRLTQPLDSPAPMLHPEIIRSLEIQNSTIAIVMMVILCSVFTALAFRTKKPAGYLTSLSQSQQLLILDPDTIDAAPEFLQNIESKQLFVNVVDFLSDYLNILQGRQDEPPTERQKQFSHHLANTNYQKEEEAQVIQANNAQAQTKLVIPAIVGESQSTQMWRFLEKISFMQKSAKAFLSSRLQLNRDLARQQPYDYQSPQEKKSSKPTITEDLPLIYETSRILAQKSSRQSQSNEKFQISLHRQSELNTLTNMASDFNLVHFAIPTALNKFSKADKDPQPAQAH